MDTITSCEKGRVAGAEGLIGECSAAQVVVGGRVFVSVPLIACARCGFPSCCATAIQVPLRGATTSIAWGIRNAVRVNWCLSLCSFFAESRAYRRLGYGWIVWMVGYGSSASSRLASYRGVLSRFVSSAGRYRDSYGRRGSNGGRVVEGGTEENGRRTLECYPCAGCEKTVRRRGCRPGRRRAGYAAVVVGSRQQ